MTNYFSFLSVASKVASLLIQSVQTEQALFPHYCPSFYPACPTCARLALHSFFQARALYNFQSRLRDCRSCHRAPTRSPACRLLEGSGQRATLPSKYLRSGHNSRGRSACLPIVRRRAHAWVQEQARYWRVHINNEYDSKCIKEYVSKRNPSGAHTLESAAITVSLWMQNIEFPEF